MKLADNQIYDTGLILTLVFFAQLKKSHCKVRSQKLIIFMKKIPEKRVCKRVCKHVFTACALP